MKKYNYLITTLLSFILLPCITYANCTSEEIQHFKEIEDQYKVTYEFNEDTKDYTLSFYMPQINSYAFTLNYDIKEEPEEIEEDEKLILKFSGFKAGEYTFDIVGNTDSCSDVLSTVNIKLSKSNQYYEDPLCEGIEEFVLCQPTYDKNISYEDFVSRVNTYKKTKKNNEEEKIQNNPENAIVNYIKDNLFQIIVIVVFIIIIAITIILTVKSIKKSRRLE